MGQPPPDQRDVFYQIKGSNNKDRPFRGPVVFMEGTSGKHPPKDPEKIASGKIVREIERLKTAVTSFQSYAEKDLTSGAGTLFLKSECPVESTVEGIQNQIWSGSGGIDS